MNFDDELFALDERTDLSEDEVREESIKIIQKWLPYLDGEERILAQSNLAKLYLDRGTDIKERMMNAHMAKPYFLEVLKSDTTSSIQAAAAYHLGHVAILEYSQREALEWFEKALLSECIDRGRKIKSFYQAARCSFALHNIEKAQNYLEMGRSLDSARKYQSEYEAVYYLLQMTPQERKPFMLHKNGAEPVPLSYDEYNQLCHESKELVLDLGTDQGPLLWYDGFSSRITDDFAELIKDLATAKTPPPDEYWLVNIYRTIKSTSLRTTVDRILNSLRSDGFPDFMVRQQNKYQWNGAQLLVIKSVWPK
ncbi:hypothetical protein PP175_04005 [Aneurinibacillus sp. Ricciae_BoGa-3]|uniref:hypothetical protein n=1 Tax=Aneurinibacillus sp. Ricciae_BoGa-3 TaxID=3022697 RepID=UPI00234246A0|nr:hypothetical protein [Aneurinibacillus sp. Ricciae_BoGa-3]WCK55159.1 hypothetical protein PP175_04005 [Aneurinibacillus sp. Ricciae_BoGa-3]